MSKFDLRKYIPFLGAMGYLDDEPKEKKTIEIKLEYRNDDEYNNMMNDLVQKFDIKNENNRGHLYMELEDLLDKNVDKFLEAWEYVVVKYEDYVYRTDDSSISSEVCDMLLHYISSEVEDKEVFKKTCEFVKSNDNLKNILFKKNKCIESYGAGVFLCSILYDYGDDELFKEILNLIYENSLDNETIDFNDIVNTIIEAQLYDQTSNKMDVLKENIENKIIDTKMWDTFKEKYAMCLEYEDFLKKEEEELREIEEKNGCESEYIRVVGVNYENRRQAFDKLEKGETVILVREPDNMYDKNSIKVINSNNEMLGYIAKESAKTIAPRMDNNEQFKANVISLYGNTFLIRIL